MFNAASELKLCAFFASLRPSTAVMLFAGEAMCAPGQYPVVTMVPTNSQWTHVVIARDDHSPSNVVVVSYASNYSEVCINEVSLAEYICRFWPALSECWCDWMHVTDVKLWIIAFHQSGVVVKHTIFRATADPTGLAQHLVDYAEFRGFAGFVFSDHAFIGLVHVNRRVVWMFIGPCAFAIVDDTIRFVTSNPLLESMDMAYTDFWRTAKTVNRIISGFRTHVES